MDEAARTRALRLRAQGLTRPRRDSAAGVAQRLVAIQAQERRCAEWSAVRLRRTHASRRTSCSTTGSVTRPRRPRRSSRWPSWGAGTSRAIAAADRRGTVRQRLARAAQADPRPRREILRRRGKAGWLELFEPLGDDAPGFLQRERADVQRYLAATP